MCLLALVAGMKYIHLHNGLVQVNGMKHIHLHNGPVEVNDFKGRHNKKGPENERYDKTTHTLDLCSIPITHPDINIELEWQVVTDLTR
jgi:hypothetical protein